MAHGNSPQRTVRLQRIHADEQERSEDELRGACNNTSVCRVSDSRIYSTAWGRVYILTPCTSEDLGWWHSACGSPGVCWVSKS